MRTIEIIIDKEEFKAHLGIKDGVSPDASKITDEVLSRIRIPEDGEDGDDGDDGSPDTPDEVIEKIHISDKKIKGKKIEGWDKLVKTVDEYGTNPTGGGSQPLVIKNAGVRVSDHVTDLNFSTGLSAVYSSSGVVTVTATSTLTPQSAIYNEQVAKGNDTVDGTDVASRRVLEDVIQALEANGILTSR